MSSAEIAAGDAALAKGIDLGGVIALGLGTAVGVSIFSAMAPATALAGPGMLLSVAASAVPMYLIAISYAFLGSAAPVSGASFAWPARFLHPALGFFIAWMRIIANMGAMIVLALVLVRYVSMVTPLPTKPTMFAVLLLCLLANLFGVGVAARAQMVLLALMLVLFGVFVVWGGAHVDLSATGPLLPHGFRGVLAAAPLLMGLFFGIEAATEAGGEVADSGRAIPLGIAIAIGSATLLYLAVAFVSLGVLGTPALASSQAPILDAAKAFMGPLATPLVVLAAIMAIGTSLNAIFTLFSRSLFAMAQGGMMPAALARVHPKWKTPHIALLTVFGIACVGLLLPMQLTFLFLAVNIPNLLKYASICFAAATVVKRHPDLYAKAMFRPSRGRMLGFAYAGTICALCLVFVGLAADWRPYALLGVWAVIGIAIYLLRRR